MDKGERIKRAISICNQLHSMLHLASSLPGLISKKILLQVALLNSEQKTVTGSWLFGLLLKQWRSKALLTELQTRVGVFESLGDRG